MAARPDTPGRAEFAELMQRPEMAERFDADVDAAYSALADGWGIAPPPKSLEDRLREAREPREGDTPVTAMLREADVSRAHRAAMTDGREDEQGLPIKPAAAAPPETDAQRRARIMSGGGTSGGAW